MNAETPGMGSTPDPAHPFGFFGFWKRRGRADKKLTRRIEAGIPLAV